MLKKSINYSEQEITKAIDHLVANLLDYFREPKNEQNISQAAHIAKALSKKYFNINSARDAGFFRMAEKLVKNINHLTLRLFARDCICYATTISESPAKEIKDLPNKRTMQRQAEKELKISIASGHSPASALTRAANVLARKKREYDQKISVKRLADAHPLSDTLSAMTKKQISLPREDIKYQLLHLKKSTLKDFGGGGLYRLLERAQAFSTFRLHNLLGDELFFLCRPLGFLDQRCSMLVVEVPTSAHLHALTYRKMELLKRLQSDPAFKNVITIKLRIQGTSF